MGFTHNIWRLEGSCTRKDKKLRYGCCIWLLLIYTLSMKRRVLWNTQCISPQNEWRMCTHPALLEENRANAIARDRNLNLCESKILSRNSRFLEASQTLRPSSQQFSGSIRHGRKRSGSGWDPAPQEKRNWCILTHDRVVVNIPRQNPVDRTAFKAWNILKREKSWKDQVTYTKNSERSSS